MFSTGRSVVFRNGHMCVSETTVFRNATFAVLDLELRMGLRRDLDSECKARKVLLVCFATAARRRGFLL